MHDVNTLIDKASKVCGTDTAVAKYLEIHKSQLSEMRSGKRKMSSETAILLADLCKEDAVDAILAAVFSNSLRDITRGERIRKAIGRSMLFNGQISLPM